MANIPIRGKVELGTLNSELNHDNHLAERNLELKAWHESTRQVSLLMVGRNLEIET